MSDEPEREEGKGFKVEDRRRFTDAGEVREPDEAPSRDDGTPAEGTAKEPEEGKAGTAPGAEKAEGTQWAETPPINFSTFIISLSTQALMLLGEINDPATGAANKDVPAAKQTIDIIGMLEDKCRGNLEPHEAQLVKEVLYDLRMRYVEAVRQK